MHFAQRPHSFTARILRLILGACLVAMGVRMPIVTPASASASVSASAAPTWSAIPIRVMPLGDSITQGQGGHGPTYRYHLWNRLVTAGYLVDFVGSLNQPFTAWQLGMPAQVGPFATALEPWPYADFDLDHEGHAGWKAEDLLANIDNWMRAYRPGIVLLQIGTNDLASKQTVTSTLTEMGQLIDHMRMINPGVKVGLATLIPCTSPLCPPAVWAEFNALLPALIASKNTEESPLFLVDQNNGFDPARDSYDGVHPNASGDLKIANRWYPVVATMLGMPFDHSMDDGDTAFNYVGSWTRCITGCDPNGVGIYGGTLTHSSTPSDTASITFTIGFTGTSARLYLIKTERAGIATVSVNGSAEQEVDLYSKSDFGYARMWESQPLPIGEHQLRVRVTGRKVAASLGVQIGLDRLMVAPAFPLTFTYALHFPVMTLSP